MTTRPGAYALIESVADPGSFHEWDRDVVSTDPLSFVDTKPYAQRLEQMTQRSGVTESIVTGQATIHGREVVLAAGEFGFMAGTMGAATGERLLRAFDRATASRRPLLALPISGGTRMQEGNAAFIQMASSAAAVRRFRDAGLLFLVYFRNPTTGGVLASWASLAHVRFAEPRALIGMTGPRVARQLLGVDFPPGVQVAEHLRDHGLVDDVIAAPELRARVLAVLQATDPVAVAWVPDVEATTLPAAAAIAGWTAVEQSRSAQRWTVHDLLAACGAELIEVRGDGAGNDDSGCLTGLARICGHAAVVVAHDRRRGDAQRGASLGAAGYRKAARTFRLAAELGLPVLAVIDTTGAAITPHDEETGLAAAIAECLAALSAVPTPTVSVLLGEGTGGGAMAWLPADRVIAAAHGWLSPIAPEGASAILYRTTGRAAEVASAQAISATDLRTLGIVHSVVPDEDDAAPARMAAVIGQALEDLHVQDVEERLAARADHYRRLGH